MWFAYTTYVITVLGNNGRPQGILSPERFRALGGVNACEEFETESACLHEAGTKRTDDDKWSLRCTWCPKNKLWKKCQKDPLKWLCEGGKGSCHFEHDFEILRESILGDKDFSRRRFLKRLKSDWIEKVRRTPLQDRYPWGNAPLEACLQKKSSEAEPGAKRDHNGERVSCVATLTDEYFKMGNQDFFRTYLVWLTKRDAGALGMNHNERRGLNQIMNNIKESLQRLVGMSLIDIAESSTKLDNYWEAVEVTVRTLAAWAYVKERDPDKKQVKSNLAATQVYEILNRCDDQFRLGGHQGQLAQAGTVLFGHFVGGLLSVLGAGGVLAPAVVAVAGAGTSAAATVADGIVESKTVEETLQTVAINGVIGLVSSAVDLGAGKKGFAAGVKTVKMIVDKEAVKTGKTVVSLHEQGEGK